MISGDPGSDFGTFLLPGWSLLSPSNGIGKTGRSSSLSKGISGGLSPRTVGYSPSWARGGRPPAFRRVSPRCSVAPSSQPRGKLFLLKITDLESMNDKPLVDLVYGDTDSLYMSYDGLLNTIEGVETMTLEEKTGYYRPDQSGVSG